MTQRSASSAAPRRWLAARLAAVGASAWCTVGAAQGPNAGDFALERATDRTGEGLAFVETALEREAWFVGEPIAVRVRFGLEERFLEQQLVPLFPRSMDLPVQLHAEWLGGLPGVALPLGERLGEDSAGHARRGDGPSFALGETIVRGERVEDRLERGARFVVVELATRLVPQREGELRLAAPTLRFAFATKFEEGLLAARVPLDRHEALVRGEPVSLTVRPLPEAGRPPGFDGAVGEFAVRAEARPTRLGAGQSLTLQLEILGEGNFGSFVPPRLERLADFDAFEVRGVREERSAAGLLVRYDLVPRSAAVEAIPSIPFLSFDPGSASYRTLSTSPIPIRVDPAHAQAPLQEPAPTPSASDSSYPAWLLPVFALIVLAITLGRRARSRRIERPDAPRPRAFRAPAHATAQDLAAALTEYLAERLDCSHAAVVAPDLGERLGRAGVPSELAASTAAWLEALVAARFGGPSPERARERTSELIARLEGSSLGRGR